MNGSSPTDAIAGALRRQLERRGVTGTLCVDSRGATLSHEGERRVVSLDHLTEQWPTLAAEGRATRIAQLAARLGSPPAPRWTAWSCAGAVVSTLGVVGLSAFNNAPSGPADNLLAAVPALQEREARAERVCEAAASRVMRGGTVGPADAEGWVIELTVIRPATAQGVFSTTPAATYFHASDRRQARLIWPDLALGPEWTDAADVTAVESELPATDEQRPAAVSRLTFATEHAVSYFDPQQRISWVRFASGLANSLRASQAALYARCAHQSAHHVGSWFFGSTPADTASVLIWSMVGSSDSPLLKDELLAQPFDSPKAMQLILGEAHKRALQQRLNRRTLSELLAADGGLIEGRVKGPLIVRFPPVDSNRAARAALRLAREFELVQAR